MNNGTNVWCTMHWAGLNPPLAFGHAGQGIYSVYINGNKQHLMSIRPLVYFLLQNWYMFDLNSGLYFGRIDYQIIRAKFQCVGM